MLNYIVAGTRRVLFAVYGTRRVPTTLSPPKNTNNTRVFGHILFELHTSIMYIGRLISKARITCSWGIAFLGRLHGRRDWQL
jgi:hypothetical protein